MRLNLKKRLINIIKLLVSILLFFNIGSIFSYIFYILKIDISTFNFKDIAYSEVLMSLSLCIAIFFIYKDKSFNNLSL